jgi:ribosomal protein S27E
MQEFLAVDFFQCLNTTMFTSKSSSEVRGSTC